MNKITINRAREILLAYGSRPEAWPHSEREAMEVLLRSSSDLQSDWQTARELDQLLAESEAPEPSIDLETRILGSMPAPVRRKSSLGRWFRPLGAAAAATVCMGVGAASAYAVTASALETSKSEAFLLTLSSSRFDTNWLETVE